MRALERADGEADRGAAAAPAARRRCAVASAALRRGRGAGPETRRGARGAAVRGSVRPAAVAAGGVMLGPLP